jgi:predicted Zn finger-like uncharacterized protein
MMAGGRTQSTFGQSTYWRSVGPNFCILRAGAFEARAAVVSIMVAATASLDVCPTCKTVYEVVRHHIRPPADPVCETCQQTLPVADGNDWLTYLVIRTPRPGVVVEQ